MIPGVPLPDDRNNDESKVTNRRPTDGSGKDDSGLQEPTLGDEQRERLIRRIEQEPPQNGWDQLFIGTPTVVLVLFALICGAGCIGLVVGIGGLAFCRHPAARDRAKMFMALAVTGLVLRIVIAA